jgi:hypothetical protein
VSPGFFSNQPQPGPGSSQMNTGRLYGQPPVGGMSQYQPNQYLVSQFGTNANHGQGFAYGQLPPTSWAYGAPPAVPDAYGLPAYGQPSVGQLSYGQPLDGQQLPQYPPNPNPTFGPTNYQAHFGPMISLANTGATVRSGGTVSAWYTAILIKTSSLRWTMYSQNSPSTNSPSR